MGEHLFVVDHLHGASAQDIGWTELGNKRVDPNPPVLREFSGKPSI